MHILIDTNVYSAYMQGDQSVLDLFITAEKVYISVIVLGELSAGFRGGSKFQENRSGLQTFLNMPHIDVLTVDQETAEVFGQIQNQLKVAGKPIPINDVWLAAQAIKTGTVMVTYDRHFSRVSGLRLWNFGD